MKRVRGVRNLYSNRENLFRSRLHDEAQAAIRGTRAGNGDGIVIAYPCDLEQKAVLRKSCKYPLYNQFWVLWLDPKKTWKSHKNEFDLSLALVIGCKSCDWDLVPRRAPRWKSQRRKKE